MHWEASRDALGSHRAAACAPSFAAETLHVLHFQISLEKLKGAAPAGSSAWYENRPRRVCVSPYEMLMVTNRGPSKTLRNVARTRLERHLALEVFREIFRVSV